MILSLGLGDRRASAPSRFDLLRGGPEALRKDCKTIAVLVCDRQDDVELSLQIAASLPRSGTPGFTPSGYLITRRVQGASVSCACGGRLSFM